MIQSAVLLYDVLDVREFNPTVGSFKDLICFYDLPVCLEFCCKDLWQESRVPNAECQDLWGKPSYQIHILRSTNQ